MKQDYCEVTNTVQAFTGGFDHTALIDVLFEEAPTHPEHDTLFIEREYTNEEVYVTNWVSAYVPTDSGETMLAERWFTSPEHVGYRRGMVAVVSLRTRLSLKHWEHLTRPLSKHS